MAQITSGIPAAEHPLPLAKSTDLGLTHAVKRAWPMPGQMLTPDTYGTETFFMGTFHDSEPSMSSCGLEFGVGKHGAICRWVPRTGYECFATPIEAAICIKPTHPIKPSNFPRASQNSFGDSCSTAYLATTVNLQGGGGCYSL